MIANAYESIIINRSLHINNILLLNGNFLAMLWKPIKTEFVNLENKTLDLCIVCFFSRDLSIEVELSVRADSYRLSYHLVFEENSMVSNPVLLVNVKNTFWEVNQNQFVLENEVQILIRRF